MRITSPIHFCLTVDVSPRHSELEIFEKVCCSCSLLKHFYEAPLTFERKKNKLRELNCLVLPYIDTKWCYSDINSITRNFSASSQEQRWLSEPLPQPVWAENNLPSWSRGLCTVTGSSTHLRPASDLLCSSINQWELHPLQWKPSGFTPEQLKLEACPKWAGAHYKTK